MTDPRINTLEKADRYQFLMDALRTIGLTCTFTKGGKEEFKLTLKNLEKNQQVVTRLEHQIALYKAEGDIEEVEFLTYILNGES